MSDAEADLRQQVKTLRRQLTIAREAAERRNRDLDALHLVWCDGGCPRGVHRYQDQEVLVTEELVAAAERNTKRLRAWYEGVKFRFETYGPDPLDPSRQFPTTASEWHRQYAARAAVRTDIPDRKRKRMATRRPQCPDCEKLMHRRVQWVFFPGRRGSRTVNWVCRNTDCSRHVKR